MGKIDSVQVLAKLRNNKLFVNSFLLMSATGATALFGFVFWVVVARHFNSGTVGVATTMLSISSLLALLSLVGFDTVLIRFLAKSSNKNNYISTGFVLVGITSAIISGIFCLLIPILSPKLGFIDHHPLYIVAFIIFTVFTAWNSLTNAIFVAYRRTSFVLAINIIFSALKMSLPFFIGNGGPMTIFLFVGIAQVVNVIISVDALITFFEYKPSLKIHKDVLKEIKLYGVAAYFASLFNLLPDSALPIIVINELGASAAAYFYIAFTIANLLYNIGFSTVQSLFAESSYDENAIKSHLEKAVKIMTILLIPATAVIILVSSKVLEIFGHGYSHGSTDVLRILSLSGLFVAFYSLLGTIFKIKKQLRAMIIVNFTNAIVIIILSVVFAHRFGLVGVGWAWFIGNVAACFVGMYFIQTKFRFLPKKSKAVSCRTFL